MQYDSRSLAINFDADNRATTTEVRGIRFRKVLLYQRPEVRITEESELIDILILVKWSNGCRNRLVWHTSPLQIRRKVVEKTWIVGGNDNP